MPRIITLLLLRTQCANLVGRGVAVGLLSLLLAGAVHPAQAHPAAAQRWPTHPTAAAAEAQNETAAPSLSRHVHDAARITGYLADALSLSTAQQIALQHCTVAERSALLLATSEKDTRDAQACYLASVRRLLAPSQLRAYMLLRQQLEGTLLPLDGLDLAAR